MGATLGIAAPRWRSLLVDEEFVKHGLVLQPALFAGRFRFRPAPALSRSARRGLPGLYRVPERRLGGGSPPLRSGRGRALARVPRRRALRGAPPHTPERLVTGRWGAGEVVAHHALASGVQHRGDGLAVRLRFRLRFRLPPPGAC